jgi:RibD C-terminal domain
MSSRLAARPSRRSYLRGTRRGPLPEIEGKGNDGARTPHRLHHFPRWVRGCRRLTRAGGLEGPEYLALLGEQSEADYTVLIGTNTYRVMSGYATEGEPGTDVLVGLSKVVFSTTLSEPLSRANTQLVPRDPVEAVREMKDKGSKSMRTMGSLTPCRSLLNAGLVDRFRVVGLSPRHRRQRPGADLRRLPRCCSRHDQQPHVRRSHATAPTILAGPPGTNTVNI